jgi:hypothetical protein
MRSQIVTSSRRKLEAPPYVVFDAIKRLIAEDQAGKTNPKRRIGFIS